MSDLEQDAIQRLLSGDVRGLETVVNAYQLRALRTAYAITGDRQLAEEVVIDAFMKVHQHIAQFDTRRRFVPWFYRIVVNEGLKAARRAKRRAASPLSARIVDESAHTEQEAIAREMHLLLVEAIRSLRPKQRVVLALRYYLDLDDLTIADIVKSPVGTVKGRLHAARTQLRRRLLSAGVSAMDVG